MNDISKQDFFDLLDKAEEMTDKLIFDFDYHYYDDFTEKDYTEIVVKLATLKSNFNDILTKTLRHRGYNVSY